VKAIAINGRFLSQPITGVQRYARELVRALDEMLHGKEIDSNGCEVELLVPTGYGASFKTKFIQLREVGSFQGQIWEQFELPFHCKKNLLFTPCCGAPVIHKDHVITIHDAGIYATPDAYSAKYRAWYKGLYKSLLAKTRKVITVSAFSKSQLSHWFGINPDKIAVTHLGCDHIDCSWTDRSFLNQYELQKFSYVLAVSSRNPNKNFNGILTSIQFLRNSNYKFVIAGGSNSRIFRNSRDLPSSVVEVGYVNDAQLRALYENAACFVFPSFYEGFGLPPLEAMSLGCPVVVSQAASLPEVCGDLAYYCDPNDPKDIAKQIEAALTESVNKLDLISHARLFQWRNCAKQTWEIIQKTIS
jgi:glycosyltransferase involved in cell wall biosynthesis